MSISDESILFIDEERIQPVGRLLAVLRIAARELNRHAGHPAELANQITPAVTAVFLEDVAILADSVAGLADTLGASDIGPAADLLRATCQQAYDIRRAGCQPPPTLSTGQAVPRLPSDHNEMR